MKKSVGISVGILGGGQLALMLAQAAERLGFRPAIFTDEPDGPAATGSGSQVFVGSLSDAAALKKFFNKVESVVFENEFVHCALLEEVAGLIPKKMEFYPSLKVIEALQDKLNQKRILERLQIPLAPFLVMDGNSADPFITECLRKWNGECVLKWARMGYDGKGVLVVDRSPESHSRAVEFCKDARQRGSSVYAEEKIKFKKELALVAARSVNGEFAHYPLVISEQVHGICHRVYGPAVAAGVNPRLEARAREYAQTLATAMGIVGVFALELFETDEGRLMVNEIAPRVHNSGHFTQDACDSDQFETHWRAIMGLPLEGVRSKPCFGMLNLLGPERVQGEVQSRAVLPSGNGTQLHWYFKKEVRPGRKMGHINAVGESPQALSELLQILDHSQKQWEDWVFKHMEDNRT